MNGPLKLAAALLEELDRRNRRVRELESLARSLADRLANASEALSNVAERRPRRVVYDAEGNVIRVVRLEAELEAAPAAK